MKKEIYVCDRCNREVKKMEHFDNFKHRNQWNLLKFDLCNECVKELKKFIWRKD